MTLCRLVSISLLLWPLAGSAHNFIIGERVKPIMITDRGALLLNDGRLHYQRWRSSELAGKVRVVQYIAGRTSAKKKNALLISAIKDAKFPADRFQPTTIVNTDDEIVGTGFFVQKKIEKNKKRYPWAQFIIDSHGLGQKTWQLEEENSTILLLDNEGHIQWVKEGALTPKEVREVINNVLSLLNEQPHNADSPK
ncbi:YtfJ family protein [Erwinia sp. AnSW2-5]|uniref:YtfJ family protein n=1 Tax=Erwinia sp. AnSW2-5 TaxID=3367692 RepID=UPI0038595E1D